MNDNMQKAARVLSPLLFLCLFLLSGCREDRQDRGWQNQDFTIDEILADESRDSADFILKKAMARNTRFSTFAANLDIRLKLDKHVIGFGGQLRVKKDEILWASCQKFGFELFRAKATPDSLVFYSKPGNMASAYVADSMKELLCTTFSLMQCLFMRQTDSTMLKGDRTLSSAQDTWILNGLANDSVAWQLHVGKEDFRPTGIGIQVRQDRSTLQIHVSYRCENGFDVRLSENGKSMVEASVDYVKTRWNETLSYPLSVPAGIRVEMNHGLMKNLEKSRRQHGLETE